MFSPGCGTLPSQIPESSLLINMHPLAHGFGWEKDKCFVNKIFQILTLTEQKSSGTSCYLDGTLCMRPPVSTLGETTVHWEEKGVPQPG